jgi:hypothetical protein
MDTSTGSPSKVTILSISLPEKLARQVRLLAKIEGITMTALLMSTAGKDVPARLKAALADMQSEVE